MKKSPGQGCREGRSERVIVKLRTEEDASGAETWEEKTRERRQ